MSNACVKLLSLINLLLFLFKHRWHRCDTFALMKFREYINDVISLLCRCTRLCGSIELWSCIMISAGLPFQAITRTLLDRQDYRGHVAIEGWPCAGSPLFSFGGKEIYGAFPGALRDPEVNR